MDTGLLHTLRVLVVEDDVNIRRVMKELLSLRGHEASLAADGECALKQLQSESFDLMITDLGLPGITGWELARASKRYQTDMPIIAISSWQGKEAEARIGEYGIDIMIWKPFRFDQILEAIATLCADRRPESPSKF
jgi:DNA-binding response OmpR family regulator